MIKVPDHSYVLGNLSSCGGLGQASQPSILKRFCLGDIMHCPGKKGVDVCWAIEKQLARVGMNCFDVVVATGDGGG